MLAFFNILSPGHLLLLGIVALLLFGKRLPEVGRSLGKGIMEFKKGLKDVSNELNRETDEDRPRRRLRPPAEPDYDYEDEDDADEERRPPKRQPKADAVAEEPEAEDKDKD
jgi:sec-independent protein translocase protein TatA